MRAHVRPRGPSTSSARGSKGGKFFLSRGPAAELDGVGQKITVRLAVKQQVPPIFLFLLFFLVAFSFWLSMHKRVSFSVYRSHRLAIARFPLSVNS